MWQPAASRGVVSAISGLHGLGMPLPEPFSQAGENQLRLVCCHGSGLAAGCVFNSQAPPPPTPPGESSVVCTHGKCVFCQALGDESRSRHISAEGAFQRSLLK